MPKRKAKDLEIPEEPRRTSRRISTAKEDVSAERTVVVPKEKTLPKRTAVKKTKAQTSKTKEKKEEITGDKPKDTIKESDSKATKKEDAPSSPAVRQYWLMKAEPESRIEKGHDIKFSIDDLAAKTKPEPWDGIRAYPARNNLRAMKKGDLAFFYHSSCKVPAIVGIMEIVQEHTPDRLSTFLLSQTPIFHSKPLYKAMLKIMPLLVSAHDSSLPYYDPKSKPEDPKWSVVHVEFRQKLETPITLKEMKEWQGEKGHTLENMQMLKRTRLSVSAVREEEWEFLIKQMEQKGDVVEL